MRYRLLSLAVGLAFAAIAVAADPVPVPLPKKNEVVPGQAKLQLKIPPGWQDHTRPTPPGMKAAPTAVQLDTREPGGAFSVQLVFFKLPPGKTLGDDDLKNLLTKSTQQYVATSVEKEVKPEPIKSDTIDGYSATFTDSAADPGRFACVTVVNARLADGLVVATISHPKDSKNLPLALDMIKAAKFGPAATQPAVAVKTEPVRVESPDGKWALVFDLPGAAPAEADHQGGAQAVRLETETTTGILCTTFIEPPATAAADARAVRDYYWAREKKAPLDYSDIQLSGDAKLAILKFKTMGTVPNVHGYLIHNGTWIDIHLSSPTGAANEVAVMEKAVKSARFVLTPVK